MNGTDKFLIGIVAGIVILVVVVFLVVLLRPEPEYRGENSPESVVYNYLLALQKGDLERALSYIATNLKHAPKDSDEFEFLLDINGKCSFGDLDRDTSLSVVATDFRGNQAEVQVKQSVFYSGDFFHSKFYESEFEMTLKQQKNTWKLITGDRYWCSCWNEIGGCK